MNERITAQICEKSMSGDFTTEISMPDYEPEIRRLLRVGVTLTPPLGFSDGGRVGMNGEIIYNVLYMGNDGQLYSTKTRESYELAEALKQLEKGEEITGIICSVFPDSVVSRAVAPRKISIKCKLKGTAKAFGWQEIAEKSTYIENPDSIERLQGEAVYSEIFPSVTAEAVLSEDFTPDVPISGDLRIITHTSAAVCESIEPSHGDAVVKGSLVLSVLAAVDDSDEKPFRITKKMPFAERVEADWLTPASKCIAEVCPTECEFGVEDNRIACEVGILIKLDSEEERRAVYTRDIYSTEVYSETTVARYEHPLSKRCFSGNFTSSLREELDTAGITDGAEVADATAVSVVKNIEFNDDKMALVGETLLNLLINTQNEYSTKEFKIPFRYETECGKTDQSITDCRVVSLPPRAKIDSGRILCDCELCFSGRIYEKSYFDALDQVVFGDRIEKDNAITVCFPSPTDSLWDVSKRYHIPTERIISQESQLKKQEPIVF